MHFISNGPSSEGPKHWRVWAAAIVVAVTSAFASFATAQTLRPGESYTWNWSPTAGKSYSWVTSPTKGTISMGGGKVTYTARANATPGQDSFAYGYWYCSANCPDMSLDGISANITIVAPPAPSLTGGSFSVQAGKTNVHNFAPTEGGVLSISVPPQHGTVTIDGGMVIYTAAADYVGADSFKAIATNGVGPSQAATVNVTITAPPIPVLTGGHLALDYLTGGYHDFAPTNGGTLSLSTPPAHGFVTIYSDGRAFYNPGGYIGTDSFGVTASNLGGTSAETTVSVTVAPPPVPNPAGGSLNLAFNTAGDFAFQNMNGGAISVVTPPTNGVVTFRFYRATYTPNAGFVGTDSFTITGTNAGGTSAPATVNITVAPPPIPTLTGGQLDLAFNTSGTHDFAPTQGGTLAVASAASHGTVTINGGRATYTPNTDYIGPDSFAVTGTNLGGTSAPTTIAVTVAPPPIPALTAGSLTLAFNEAGTHDFAPTDRGVLALAQAPAHGTVTLSGGRATYTPDVDYIGADSFGVTAANLGGVSAVMSIPVTVAPPPIPVLTGGSLSLPFNTSGTHDFVPTDRGVLAIATAALHGSLDIVGGRVTYSPAPDYIGPDTFSVTGTNLGGTSAPVVVSVTVSPPDAPGAGSASIVATYEQAGSVELPVSGIFSSVELVDPPAHGQVTLSGSRATFTPDLRFFGSDSFTYRAIGLGGPSGPASVAITVARPGAPVVASAKATTAYATKVTIPLEVTGLVDGLRIEAPPANGMAAIDGQSVIFAPGAGHAGQVTFKVVAFGPGGDSPAADIVVTVQEEPVVEQPKPPGPTAKPGPVTMEGEAGTKLRFRVTAGLSGGPFTAVEVVTQPATGTAEVDDLDVVYSPPTGFVGQVAFDYRVVTPSGPTEAATLTAVVRAPAPEAPVKEVVATPDQPATVNLTEGVQDGPFSDAVIISMSPASAGTAELVREAAAPRSAASASAARGKLAGGSSAMATESPESFHLRFLPAENYFGEVVIRYGLTNRYAGLTQGVVRIMVDTRPDPTSKASVAATLNAQVSIAGRFSDAVLDNAGRRLEARRAGASGNAVGLSSARSSQDPFADPVKERWMAEMEVLKAEHDEHSAGRQSEGRGRAQVWVGGNVTLGEQRKAGRNSGFEFSTAGVSVGADTEIGDGLVFGAGIGLARDRSDLGDAGLVRATGYSGFVYGSWPINDALYLDGVLGGGRVDFKGERKDGAEIFESERSGQIAFAAITLGAAVDLGGWSVDPYGGMRLSRARLQGYQEGGPAATALRFGAQDVESNSGVIGLRGRRAFKAGEGWLEPSFRGEYRFSGSETGRATVGYANGQEGVFYALELLDLTDHRAMLGAGLAWRPAGAWNFNFDVEQAWWERGLSTTLRFGAAGRF